MKIRLYNKETMIQQLVSTTAFNQVSDGEVIADNSVAYNNNYKALRINDSSVQTKIDFNIPLGKLFPGDKVKVSFERMNISGDPFKVAVDLYNNHDYSDTNFLTLASINTPKTSSFETFENTFTIIEEKYCRLILGVFSVGVGDNYIRNIEIDVERHNEDINLNSFQSSISFDSKIGNISFSQNCFYTVKDGLCKLYFNFDVTAFSITQGFATYIQLPLASKKSVVTGSAYVYNTSDGENVIQPLTLTAGTSVGYLKTPNVISTKFKVGTKLYGFVEYPV